MDEEDTGGVYLWEPVTDEITQGYIDKVREALDNSQYQDALDICVEAEKANITHPRLIVAKSDALTKLKKFDEAQAFLEESLKEFPYDPILHYKLAINYHNNRRRADAKKEASRVLELVEVVEDSEMDARLSMCNQWFSSDSSPIT